MLLYITLHVMFMFLHFKVLFKVSHCFWGLDTFLRSPPQLCPLLNMANLELGGITWYGVEVHT
jgi:hypothetical protein